MIACVLIPNFAVTIEQREDGALTDVPLVVVKYGSRKGKVVARSVEAAQKGIEIGMSLSRARALCPSAYFRPFDEGRMDSGIESLLNALWTFTNRIEVDTRDYPQNGVFYLDLGRLKDDDLHFLCDRLRETLSTLPYPSVSLGIASSKLPAYIAATRNVPFVPVGEEAQFIQYAPITLLPLTKAMAHRLNLLRIRTFGDFALLPRSAVAGQFGKVGQELHQLALGQDYRSVKPRKMPLIETVSRQFDHPITHRDRLNVVLSHITDELVIRLENRNAALHEIALTLYFENGKQRVERLHLLQPIRSRESLYRTLQGLLDRKALTSGITLIEVRLAHLVSSIPRQLELFSYKPQSQALIDLAQALTRRYGQHFYKVTLAEEASLLPEERFQLQLVGGA